MKASKKSYMLNNRYSRGKKNYVYIYMMKCIQERDKGRQDKGN